MPDVCLHLIVRLFGFLRPCNVLVLLGFFVFSGLHDGAMVVWSPMGKLGDRIELACPLGAIGRLPMDHLLVDPRFWASDPDPVHVTDDGDGVVQRVLFIDCVKRCFFICNIFCVCLRWSSRARC